MMGGGRCRRSAQRRDMDARRQLVGMRMSMRMGVRMAMGTRRFNGSQIGRCNGHHIPLLLLGGQGGLGNHLLGCGIGRDIR